MIFDKLTAVMVLVKEFDGFYVGSLTRAVHLRHHEASQDDLVEGRIGSACHLLAHKARAASMPVLTSQELVQAHQQLDVGVGRLRDLCILVNPRALELSCCV